MEAAKAEASEPNSNAPSHPLSTEFLDGLKTSIVDIDSEVDLDLPNTEETRVAIQQLPHPRKSIRVMLVVLPKVTLPTPVSESPGEVRGTKDDFRYWWTWACVRKTPLILSITHNL